MIGDCPTATLLGFGIAEEVRLEERMKAPAVPTSLLSEAWEKPLHRLAYFQHSEE